MAKAEDEWSDDCSDIWNFDDVCSTLISEHFSLNTGDSWKKERSMNSLSLQPWGFTDTGSEIW